MSNTVQSPQTFDEWFDSLTEEQQKEYVEEMKQITGLIIINLFLKNNYF